MRNPFRRKVNLDKEPACQQFREAWFNVIEQVSPTIPEFKELDDGLWSHARCSYRGCENTPKWYFVLIVGNSVFRTVAFTCLEHQAEFSKLVVKK